MTMIDLLSTFLAFVLSTPASLPNSSENLHVKAQSLSTLVSFRRDGFSFRRYLVNSSEEQTAVISCYSFGDQNREKFAEETGSDPVADLSCYLKDLRRKNEYTVLSVPGEGLQFSPAFFWFSDVAKCSPQNYRVDARVRGIRMQISMYDIDVRQRTATMRIAILPDASAKNTFLGHTSYFTSCF